MARASNRRLALALPTALTALALVLTGCAQGGSTTPTTAPVTASPGGPDAPITATPDAQDDSATATPGSPDNDDPNVLGAPFATWKAGAAEYTVTTFGSSTCLPEVTGVTVGANNTITLSTRDSANEVCTADFGPRTWTLDTPDAIDPQSEVRIEILAPTDEGDDASITLAPID